MAIGINILIELVHLKRQGTLGAMNKVVEIGAQQLTNALLSDHAGLAEACRVFGQKAPPFMGHPTKADNIAGTEALPCRAPPSQPLWEALGFEYATIDFDGHRNSSVLDLNKDAVKADWKGRFDLAINAGTTEHVANQDNAFRAIHDLTRPGGIMIHELPAGGMMTHGLIVYTPKFFWALCRENRYDVLRLDVMPGGTASLHPYVVDSNRQFGRQPMNPRLQEEPIRDWALFATLRKPTAADFVTPMDLPPELMPRHPA